MDIGYLTINSSFSLVPLKLHGEGSYQLTSVKDVRVTNEFLSLDVKDRKCQHESTLSDCQTDHYISQMKNICHCLPFSIWSPDKDKVKIYQYF